MSTRRSRQALSFDTAIGGTMLKTSQITVCLCNQTGMNTQNRHFYQRRKESVVSMQVPWIKYWFLGGV